MLLNLVAGSVLSLLAVEMGEEQFASEVETEYAEEALQLISIPVGVTSSENFLRLNEHEIRYNEKLYDIKRIVVSDGFVNYYCVNDSKEEKILEGIRQCTALNFDYFSTGNHTNPGASKIFTQENSVPVKIKRELPVLDFIYTVDHINFYSNIFLEVNYPPPEVVA